ncbi:dTMP kinase [Roseateles sp.]|uniref:dTMP kinase n=1 Tax=Roseateles sp. TaxID=1971397 RepID=UPI0039DF53D7
MQVTARFITFEGIDGAGKSTHIAALTERLKARGAVVVNTREPGGTALAETLRGLFLHSGMDSLTEALLVFAGRRDHLQRVIEPALAAGQTVLCDRYTDASFAYQGAGRGMDLGVLTTLEQWVQNGRQPDLTLWFDLPAEMAAARRAAAREADRFEQQDLAFFERVRGGYAARAAAAPQRFARIDASLSVAEVAAQIVAVMEARGW